MTLFSEGLIFPAMVLALLGWLVPKLLSQALPEGVKPLMINAFFSTVILFALSAIFFVLLYVWQGMSLAQMAQLDLLGNVVFFGKLGLIATLIWGPIMILCLASLPRNWVEKVW